MPFAERAHRVVRGVERRDDRAAGLSRGEITDEKEASNGRLVLLAQNGRPAVEVDTDRLEEVLGRRGAEREDDVVERLALRSALGEVDAGPPFRPLDAGDVRAGREAH